MPIKEATQVSHEQKFQVGDSVKGVVSGTIYTVVVAEPDRVDNIIVRTPEGNYVRVEQSRFKLRDRNYTPSLEARVHKLEAQRCAHSDRLLELEQAMMRRVTELENFRSRVTDLLQSGAANV